MLTKILLTAEFLALYFLLPLSFALLTDISPVAVLLPLAVIQYIIIRYGKNAEKKLLFHLRGLKSEAGRIILVFISVSVCLLIFTSVSYPDSLFSLPAQRPAVWILIMILYPLLSVMPQEIIFRGYIFHRYRRLIPNERDLLHISAWAFSFAHIIYFHPVSLLLSLGGGYLFGITYKRTGSLLIAGIEHSLYGCMIFTIGLGRFFYGGR